MHVGVVLGTVAVDLDRESQKPPRGLVSACLIVRRPW